MRPVRVVRSLRAVIVTAVVTALVVFPLGALASHSFTDVPNTHPFHADIAALKDSGVSPTGCGGGKFCPDDFVTRGQMAAFLNRIGALGPGKVPVANATKLDGLDSTAFQKRVSGTCAPGSMVTAVNDNGSVGCAADAIDGGDAALLDGLDSTAFAEKVVEDWHEVGTASEYGFSTCSPTALWTNATIPFTPYNSAGYYKDPWGVVHMKGLLSCEGGGGTAAFSVLFSLRAGYWPAKREIHVGIASVLGVSDTLARVDVHAEGYVSVETPVASLLSLDGITFRAAP